MNALCSAGSANAGKQVADGSVDKTSDWSFTADDGNAMLGPNGDNWGEYAKWHLGVDAGADPKTKAHYKYPFGKGGKVYRSGLVAAKQRAAAQGDTDIEARAGTLVDAIDKAKAAAGRLQRAYSTLKIKAVDEELRQITGIASTPTPDSYGDIVEPEGAEFNLPIPLLWQHDPSCPVGHVTQVRTSAGGIEMTAQMVKPDASSPPSWADRLNCAWADVKSMLVRGLSIGFIPVESARIEGTYGYRYTKWSWLELSCVTIPANADASISMIRSVDRAILRAATGLAQGRPVVRLGASPLPGASGPTQKHRSPQEGKDMTIQEQIKALEAKRAAHQARLTAIAEKVAAEGRTKEDAEQEEHKNLMGEVNSIDGELKDLRDLEKISLKAAVVPAGGSADDATRTRAPGTALDVGRGRVISLSGDGLPKGRTFVRYVMALARSRGNLYEAQMFAENTWKDTPQVGEVLKSAVAAGTTTDPTWASQLVFYQNMVNEFVELLRPLTLIGRFGANGVPALRRIPFNVRMATQTGGGVYQWVGQGAPKPVGKLSLDQITLKWAKAAGIIVVTDELMRFSTPAVEGVVQNDMLKGTAQFLDGQFVNPNQGEVADVSPASIFNGTTTVTASGTDAAAFRKDLGDLIDTLIANNLTPTTGVLLMSSRQALRLGLMRNALGNKEFPDVTISGGIIEGFPVLASESVPDDSNGGLIGIVNADDVFFADDGPVTIDISREASVQMNDAPDNPASASTVLTSLWQNNLVGLRAERYINWKKRRSFAAAYIKGANYR